MTLSKKSILRKGATLALMTAIVFGSAVPAFAADNNVIQGVTAGLRTASVAELTLGNVNYSHAAQAQTGSMTLTADDSTGSNAGWNVTIVTSAFARTGGGAAIPAANFSLTSAATPTATAGQAVDGTGGPKVPSESPVGTLDSARKVIQANASFGAGNYTQALPVSLAIPVYTAAGTYTGTLTTSVNAAP